MVLIPNWELEAELERLLSKFVGKDKGVFSVAVPPSGVVRKSRRLKTGRGKAPDWSQVLDRARTMPFEDGCEYLEKTRRSWAQSLRAAAREPAPTMIPVPPRAVWLSSSKDDLALAGLLLLLSKWNDRRPPAPAVKRAVCKAFERLSMPRPKPVHSGGAFKDSQYVNRVSAWFRAARQTGKPGKVPAAIEGIRSVVGRETAWSKQMPSSSQLRGAIRAARFASKALADEIVFVDPPRPTFDSSLFDWADAEYERDLVIASCSARTYSAKIPPSVIRALCLWVLASPLYRSVAQTAAMTFGPGVRV